ncbi:MAG: TetR/AcrR family transcriptional regulator [bacterium]
MGLREDAKNDKWQRIRAAAADQFARLGYDGTTIRSIAAQANVSPATVLVYASSKETLLHEIWREDTMPVVDAALAHAHTQDPGLERIVDIFWALIEHYASHPELARVIVPQLPMLQGEALAAHLPLLKFMVGLEALVAEMALPPGMTPQDAVRLAFSLYYAALLSVLSPLGRSATRESLATDLKWVLGSRM